MKNSTLTKKQTQKHVKHFREDGVNKTIVLNIRYDDQCGNGHNSFSMTGVVLRGNYKTEKGVRDSAWECCGCIHDEIEKRFPKFRKFLKWHLFDSDGPMYYLANTLYFSRNTDYDGLLKGEYSSYTTHVVSSEIAENEQVTLYKTGQMYLNRQNNKHLEESNSKELSLLNKFIGKLKIKYTLDKVDSAHSLSEGKTADYEAARRCAVWPEATIDQLQDKEALEARLPALVDDFAKDMESLGFTF